MAWYDDTGKGGRAISDWNLAPYQQPGGARSYGLMDGPRGDDLVSSGTPGSQPSSGGYGIFQPSEPPGYGLDDMFMGQMFGPGYTRNKEQKWKHEESIRAAQWETRRRQMQQGLLDPALTSGQADMALQGYTGAYGEEAGAAMQDMIYNMRDQRMQEATHKTDQETARRELASTMNDDQRSVLGNVMKVFDPQSKPAQFQVQTADGAESLLADATETDTAISYPEGENPFKDQALITALAKTLRPNEGLMGNDAQTIQAAMSDPSFAYWWNRVSESGSLIPAQRKQLMDVIRGYRANSVKQLGQIEERVSQGYRGQTGDTRPHDFSMYYSTPGSSQNKGPGAPRADDGYTYD